MGCLNWHKNLSSTGASHQMHYNLRSYPSFCIKYSNLVTRGFDFAHMGAENVQTNKYNTSHFFRIPGMCTQVDCV